MQHPRITIVTPSLNQGDFIEETILSVLDQDYPNLEYIIIDGGSTDQTLDIIKKYENRLTFWVSEKDKGQSDAINKGLGRASGNLFNWLNADDILEPDALRKVALEFATKDVDVIFGWCRHFSNKTKETLAIGRTSLHYNVEKTMAYYSMGQPSQYYKTEIIRELGGVDNALHYAMDMDLWFRYLAAHGRDKVKFVDDVLSHFRLHEHSKTNKDNLEFKRERMAIYKGLFKNTDVPEYMQRYLKRFNPIEGYEPDWQGANVNRNLLMAYFAERLFDDFYAQRDYENCRNCLTTVFEHKKTKNSKLLRRFVRVKVFNDDTLNFMRKLKNSLTR